MVCDHQFTHFWRAQLTIHIDHSEPNATTETAPLPITPKAGDEKQSSCTENAGLQHTEDNDDTLEGKSDDSPAIELAEDHASEVLPRVEDMAAYGALNELETTPSTCVSDSADYAESNTIVPSNSPSDETALNPEDVSSEDIAAETPHVESSTMGNAAQKVADEKITTVASGGTSDNSINNEPDSPDNTALRAESEDLTSEPTRDVQKEIESSSLETATHLENELDSTVDLEEGDGITNDVDNNAMDARGEQSDVEAVPDPIIPTEGSLQANEDVPTNEEPPSPQEEQTRTVDTDGESNRAEFTTSIESLPSEVHITSEQTETCAVEITIEQPVLETKNEVLEILDLESNTPQSTLPADLSSPDTDSQQAQGHSDDNVNTDQTHSPMEASNDGTPAQTQGTPSILLLLPVSIRCIRSLVVFHLSTPTCPTNQCSRRIRLERASQNA